MPDLAEIPGLRAELLAAYKRIDELEKELATAGSRKETVCRL
jgi:hypothetical protein